MGMVEEYGYHFERGAVNSPFQRVPEPLIAEVRAPGAYRPAIVLAHPLGANKRISSSPAGYH